MGLHQHSTEWPPSLLTPLTNGLRDASNGTLRPTELSPLPSSSDTEELAELQAFDALPPLAPEQEAIVQSVVDGHSVFFTGPAGSGKSLIIKHLKRRLHGMGKKYEITAPTGLAASLLNGRTVHSFAGIGLGDRPLRAYILQRTPAVEDTRKDVSYGRRDVVQNKINERAESIGSSYESTDVLVIDEVSMVGDIST